MQVSACIPLTELILDLLEWGHPPTPNEEERHGETREAGGSGTY